MLQDDPDYNACADRWKNMKDNFMKRMWAIFDELFGPLLPWFLSCDCGHGPEWGTVSVQIKTLASGL
jgi:hypothetical protein